MIRHVTQFGVAAAILAATAMPAAASVKGYRITYLAERGSYCVRPDTLAEAERLGILLHRTECHSAAVWATQGLTVVRG